MKISEITPACQAVADAQFSDGFQGGVLISIIVVVIVMCAYWVGRSV